MRLSFDSVRSATWAVVLSAALTAIPAVAGAAKVSIRADVESTRVAVGESFSFEITVVIDGTSSDPVYTVPALENLEVVRKSTQRGQSFVMNFGSSPKVQLTTTYSYLLVANRPGKAKIGAASARLGNDLAQTEPIVLEVTGSGAKATPQPQAPAPVPDSQLPQGTKPRGEAVLLRVVPDKFDAYVGEQIVLSLFLLTKVNLTDLQPPKQPPLEGVLLERDDKSGNLTPRIQRFAGEEYQVYEIARYAMFALREGKTTIGAFQAEAQAGASFFSAGKLYRASSPDIVINVKALPQAGKPAGFSPMNVGQLEFGAELVPGPAQVGKPLTLRMSARGVGNISKLSLPVPAFGDKLKAYDPETKSEQRFEQGVLQGRISRDYLFVPTEAGDHLIPPLVFHWFDPKTQSYQEKRTEAFSVRVNGSESQTLPRPSADSGKPSVVGAEETQYAPLRMNSSLDDQRVASRGWRFVWVGSGSTALAGLVVAFGRLRRREKSAEQIKRGARIKAHKGLKRALAASDTLAVYAEMSRVVRQYLFERFGITTGAARDRLRELLHAAHAEEGAIDTLLAELDNCDFARFAPGGQQVREAELAAQRIEEALNQIDRAKERES